jgi:predicted phosphodiesterase
MRAFIQRFLREPVGKLADRFSSRPDKNLVHQSLTELYEQILEKPDEKGRLINFTDSDKFIIFSDQHKGGKDGSDDFAFAEKNYLKALEYYNYENYHLINLGDCEELWENNILTVKKSNIASFELEKKFNERNAFTKIFGNHDLYYDNDPLAPVLLESIYGKSIRVYSGAILSTQVNGSSLNIFLTHGHQGDKQSDGNWFSKWFISTIWAPLQMYLELNLNTPAENNLLKTTHNQFMYEWVAPKKNILLVTGHTHQPVFVSLTFLERLFKKLNIARLANDTMEVDRLRNQIQKQKIKEDSMIDFSAYRPSYFNTGCCCYSDGDITGIEIADGKIRLIKWEYDDQNISRRILLEESSLSLLST